MAQSWSDFPVVETVPDAQTHFHFRDAPFHPLYMWVMGPDWVVATSDLSDAEQVVETWPRPDGTFRVLRRPRTAAEQTEIDDDLDEALAGAGLPPRPRGLNWYVKVSEAEISRLWEYVGHVDVGWSDRFEQRGDNFFAFAFRAMREKVPPALERIADSRP